MDNNYIKIYEFENYNFEPNVWLIEILKEKNIPYETKIEEYWVGNRMREYRKRLNIFIPQNYKIEVQRYIEEYQKPTYITENIPELQNMNADDEETEKQINKFYKIKKIRIVIFFAFLFSLAVIAIIGNFI